MEYKGILFSWLIKSHSLILSRNKCSCSWKGKRMRNSEQMFPILSLKKRMKNEEQKRTSCNLSNTTRGLVPATEKMNVKLGKKGCQTDPTRQSCFSLHPRHSLNKERRRARQKKKLRFQSCLKPLLKCRRQRMRKRLAY